jgi:hypothetical protein
MGCFFFVASPHWIMGFLPCDRRGHSLFHLHPVESHVLILLLIFVHFSSSSSSTATYLSRVTVLWRVAQRAATTGGTPQPLPLPPLPLFWCHDQDGCVLFWSWFIFVFSFHQYRAIISWPWRHFEGPCYIPMPFDNEIRPVGSDDDLLKEEEDRPLDLPLS